MATIVAADFRDDLRQQSRNPQSQTLRFEAQADGSYQVTTLPLQFAEDTGEPAPPGVYALPFEFPFFSESK